MDKSMRIRWKAVDCILGLLFLVVFVHVYIGFYISDPRLGIGMTLVLWCARVGLPLAGCFVVYLYLSIRSGRTPFSSTALFLASVGIGLLGSYAVLAYINNRRYLKPMREKLARFHSCLQISPQDYQPRNDTEASPSLKIFCLGGSTTQWTDSQGRGWPERVEDNLGNTSTDTPVEVHNLGRSWYTTEHTLINYAVNLRHRRPDVLIVMHAINDLLHNADFSYFSIGTFQEDYRHFLGPIYRLVKRPTASGLATTLGRRLWYYRPREVIDTDVFPGLVPFRRNLHTLVDLARSDGTSVVLMTQPYLEKESMSASEKAALVMVHSEAIGPDKQWSIDTATRGLRKYNDAVGDVANEAGVYFIDLEAVVPKNLEHFMDDVHYQDKTFDIIAGHIAEKLMELHVLR